MLLRISIVLHLTFVCKCHTNAKITVSEVVLDERNASIALKSIVSLIFQLVRCLNLTGRAPVIL